MRIAELCLQSAKDYHFHGPGGGLGFDELDAYLVSLRAVFSNPQILGSAADVAH